MTLLIADSFTSALARLAGPEQTAAKAAALDLQINPANPGLSLHKVERSRDPDFWTARVNRDLRLVLHKRDGNTVLAWVGHHDDAYAWAERRRMDVHPTTGAAQIVEIRERVEDVVIRRVVEEVAPKPRLFAREDDATLLSWGVPPDWLGTVREANEDSVLDIAAHLPAEAAESLLVAATGGRPVSAPAPTSDPYAHPDARRRFRVMADQAELAAALEQPWERWTVFLHPAQREFVERDFQGPARVIGSAGTGKTVVALHRAVRLARENSAARVLLTTFNDDLAAALQAKVALLVGEEPALQARIDVRSLARLGMELYGVEFGAPRLAMDDKIDCALSEAAGAVGDTTSLRFLREEWDLIVDAWAVPNAAAYRDLPRLGRRVRVAASRREALWMVFESARARLAAEGLVTRSQMFHRLAAHFLNHPSPYAHVVVDEAQDVSVAELHLLAALAGDRPNGLFFAGDIGQRIFRAPFPWKAAGVDIQGRSRSLKVNYRTSHQIRARSDLLLPPRLVESDGLEENRTGVVSVFEGPQPELHAFDNAEDEATGIGAWLANLPATGIAPAEICVLVRSENELPRAQCAVEAAGFAEGAIRVGTMHEAKGLEFRAVAVMACDHDVLPDEERLAAAADEATLEDVLATERHLLYVAATRAREALWVSGVKPVSEFLEDLLG